MEYFEGEPLRHVGDLPAMGEDRYGEKVAFSFYADELSYADLDEYSTRVANVLITYGVSPGDRIGLMLPNTNEFPVAYFGAIRAGGVPIPLNLRMNPDSLVFILDDAGANHLIGSSLIPNRCTDLANAASIEHTFIENSDTESVTDLEAAMNTASTELDRPERAYDDVACQPYTSGTTGMPKGVLLTHENLLSSVESYSKGGLVVDPDDSTLLVIPLFHIYALNAIMGTFLYRGATIHLQPKPEPVAILRAIDDNDITRFAGVPAIYRMMFREYRNEPNAYDLSSLDDLICAAAPLVDETRRAIEEEWNVPMLEGWGMTETAPAGTAESARGVHKSAGCVGPTLPNVDLKVVDPETRDTLVRESDISPIPDPEIDFDEETTGEIAIRGPNVFEGYHNQPKTTHEAFDDEGWFYTGDVARIDSDGHVWIIDRTDDMIITGGKNVYPAEVENALHEHPSVAEAAAVGMDHEIKGEAPVAFVVLEEEEEEDVGEQELRKFALDRVATYAHPRRIAFVDELPRSATQKIQRFKLEEETNERFDGPLPPSEEL